jgi:Txe/YoeB family toxin of Txe-Axe toxin-antitoxin module
MKGLKMFFEILAKYQQIKFELKGNFEKLRVNLRIYYAAKIKDMHQ